MNTIERPPYAKFPVVSNDRISLRQVMNSDLNELIDISFYDAIQAQTLEDAIEMNAKITADYERGDSIHWAIMDNSSKKIVGTCGYYRGFNEGVGELGCVLLPQYRGQGFMTDALDLVINFGFNEMRLLRICAITTIHNEKAIHLLKRLNFFKVSTLEGIEIKFELNREL